jgi:very-short-patch-repair endonuclease
VVAARQLATLGFEHDAVLVQVEHRRLHRLHLGVYAVGHPAVTRDGRWMAAVLATGEDAVLSHRDATALWGIADFTGPDIEVTLPGLGSRSRPGIRIHRTRRLGEHERTVVRGIPVTSVERLMIDLAATISPRHLRDAYLEAARLGLIDDRRLRRALAQGSGRRGLRHLWQIARDDSSGLARARSPLETRFHEFCREEGLPEPLLNVWVNGYLVDAYWPDANLVVELDSWEFHRGRDSFERDRAKIADLGMSGVAVVPVTDRRLAGERDKVASAIRQALGAVATPSG